MPAYDSQGTAVAEPAVLAASCAVQKPVTGLDVRILSSVGSILPGMLAVMILSFGYLVMRQGIYPRRPWASVEDARRLCQQLGEIFCLTFIKGMDES